MSVQIPNLSLIMGIINLIGALIIIHYERRTPRTAILWLLILFVVPAYGLIAYYLFGLSMHRTRRRYRTKEAQDRRGLDDLAALITADGPAPMMEDGLTDYSSLIRMLGANRVRLTYRNKVNLINDGEDKFRMLFTDLERAADHIHAEYYIVRDDELGNRFLDLLGKKAEEGVDVRLLVDGVGTRLSKGRVSELRAQGVKFLYFFPPVIERFPALNLRINHRNHRKIVVIDGLIGYLGGYNVGDEYLGLKRGVGRWRDTHLRIEGAAVQDLQARFLLDWDFTSSRPLEIEPRFFPPPGRAGEGAVQIVSGGPDKREDLVKEEYLKMIASARHRIYIQSPYFVPDESVLDALRVAALSGVEVRIMVPRLPDHPLVHWASLDYLGELVGSGVRAYLFEDGFLHAKAIVVDGLIASIGSANWDIRSFTLNFETNAIVYCKEVAARQEEAFFDDLASCQEWTLRDHQARSPWVRLKCGFSRLFSPLM
ncbi:MAG: cardiolipin synthase [Methanomassiliicoccus sp.]|nr:cardiolipin synthase [Methanomassiliicoccus sp.]